MEISIEILRVKICKSYPSKDRGQQKFNYLTTWRGFIFILSCMIFMHLTPLLDTYEGLPSLSTGQARASIEYVLMHAPESEIKWSGFSFARADFSL